MANTDEWGIETGYEDALGKWRDVAEETLARVREIMGAVAPRADAVLLAQRGEEKRLRAPAEITLEDGSSLHAEKALPADLPLGYHTLRYRDADHDTRLIVSPGLCHLPDDLCIWGWSAQLYAARSRASWGIGDLGDLRRLGRWARALGAGILLINPLQAATPTVPQQPSPYFPSSRRFRNLLYLRIEDIPGAAESGADLERLAAAGKALNDARLIDRDVVLQIKLEALHTLWSRFLANGKFDRFCQELGKPLSDFATFCVLAEHHGGAWRSWPAEYRHPDAPAVARFAADHVQRVRFYQWVQWLIDEQLARAAVETPLMQDLPIGVDPEGADAWAWQDIFAKGATVGSPPDEFNTQGQNWGLPPFIPWKLRDCGYEPFIQTIRAALRHAGGLRIDHVMGLFRLFWIPDGADPAKGAYVRYPAEELLAILALESERAQATLVGEDLGTVEEAARARLMAARVLSYRLLWFEKKPPAEFPRQALAAITTHDLPTVAGLWTGSDLEAQRELGLSPNEEGTKEIRDRLAAMASLSENSSIEEVILRAHELLAQAPAAIVAGTLEDALAVAQRPNMPGRTSERWPNWSMALPQTLEQLETNPLALAIADVLRNRKRPKTAARAERRSR